MPEWTEIMSRAPASTARGFLLPFHTRLFASLGPARQAPCSLFHPDLEIPELALTVHSEYLVSMFWTSHNLMLDPTTVLSHMNSYLVFQDHVLGAPDVRSRQSIFCRPISYQSGRGLIFLADHVWLELNDFSSRSRPRASCSISYAPAEL
jgi:hypothetical protein